MTKIKNFKKLAVTRDRKKALALAAAAFDAIDTGKATAKFLETFKLGRPKRIFVVGVGKNSFEAAAALEKKLGKKIETGVVIGLGGKKLKRVKTFKATHPYPSAANFRATRELIKLLRRAGRDDLVIAVVSGGGSTMLFQPACGTGRPAGVTLNQEINLIKNLFRKGAAIEEINTIRKHVSVARGGHLAYHAYPARMVSLIFSDVPGDDLQFIASGPTVRDNTTVRDAERVLRKYGLELKRGLIETPKEDKYFRRVQNRILVSNVHALRAMKSKAVKLGLKPKIVTAEVRGEARDVGRRILSELRKSRNKTASLYGGETTVTVRKKGKGGRNQELALATLPSIREGELIFPFASDGRDNTDFAGAISDIITKRKTAKLKLNPEKYLNNNDSYSFFKKTGDYLKTGDTGSNVSDLIIAMKNQ